MDTDITKKRMASRQMRCEVACPVRCSIQNSHKSCAHGIVLIATGLSPLLLLLLIISPASQLVHLSGAIVFEFIRWTRLRSILRMAISVRCWHQCPLRVPTFIHEMLSSIPPTAVHRLRQCVCSFCFEASFVIVLNANFVACCRGHATGAQRRFANSF